jgi:hypothetical protein
LLNGISLLSIYVFDLLLHPLSKDEGDGGGQAMRPPRNGVHRSVGWFYRVLWLLPVLGVSFYLNVRIKKERKKERKLRLSITVHSPPLSLDSPQADYG